MNVPNELVYNFIVELKRKDVNPVDRAQIIQEYMDENKLTIKKLSIESGLPTATIHDYINFNKIDKEEYTQLLDKGVTKTEIFKALRNSEYKRKKLTPNELNMLIEETTSRLKMYINNPIFDKNTLDLIKDLRNTLNRLELHLEKRLK